MTINAEWSRYWHLAAMAHDLSAQAAEVEALASAIEPGRTDAEREANVSRFRSRAAFFRRLARQTRGEEEFSSGSGGAPPAEPGIGQRGMGSRVLDAGRQEVSP